MSIPRPPQDCSTTESPRVHPASGLHGTHQAPASLGHAKPPEPSTAPYKPERESGLGLEPGAQRQRVGAGGGAAAATQNASCWQRFIFALSAGELQGWSRQLRGPKLQLERGGGGQGVRARSTQPHSSFSTSLAPVFQPPCLPITHSPAPPRLHVLPHFKSPNSCKEAEEGEVPTLLLTSCATLGCGSPSLASGCPISQWECHATHTRTPQDTHSGVGAQRAANGSSSPISWSIFCAQVNSRSQ